MATRAVIAAPCDPCEAMIDLQQEIRFRRRKMLRGRVLLYCGVARLHEMLAEGLDNIRIGCQTRSGQQHREVAVPTLVLSRA